MWLGEQITERGIGNGISLIIFAGIVIRIPSAMSNLLQLIRTDQFSLLQVLVFAALAVVVVFVVIIVERGQRRIPIQHARRVVGKRVQQGGMTYFPLRVNTAGVIPRSSPRRCCSSRSRSDSSPIRPPSSSSSRST
jgi:preprotein translocase subunit SecY